MKRLIARAEFSVMSNMIDFYIQGENIIVKPIETMEAKPGNMYSPSLRISRNDIQCLMDDLWRAGVRPAESMSQGALIGAKDKHLEDMRIIAFNKLKINI